MPRPDAAFDPGADVAVGAGIEAGAPKARERGHPRALMLRSEFRAIDYRAKAREAAGRAGASALERVRERHAQAASMWTQLAETEDRRTLSLRKRFGRAAKA